LRGVILRNSLGQGLDCRGKVFSALGELSGISPQQLDEAHRHYITGYADLQ